MYVDDMIIASDSETSLFNDINKLKEKFKIKSETLEWLLGIWIKQTTDGITLLQDLYIKSILQKFNITGPFKSQSIPIKKDWTNQERNTRPVNNETLFRSLLGSLMYLAVQTRPDISFAISRIAC